MKNYSLKYKFLGLIIFLFLFSFIAFFYIFYDFQKQKLNKRITSAVLAFPFPFGMVGLHRIYLGTKPHVPVAYIASLGGVFGILPFIDFCAITFGKNFDTYRDNGKVFMWVKD